MDAALCGEGRQVARDPGPSVTFPISGYDSGLVQGEWAMEQQRGADERGAIRSPRDRTSAA